MKPNSLRKRSFLTVLLVAGRYLFSFRKPFVKELDFIDLLIDDKALFFLTWKLDGGYRIQIRQTQCTFYGQDGSVVLLLKGGVQVVDIHLSNLWRKTKIQVRLNHTRFDAETKAYLLGQIRTVKKNGEVVWHTPLAQLNVQPFQIDIINRHIEFGNTAPRPRNFNLVFHKKPVIRTDKLTYQK